MTNLRDKAQRRLPKWPFWVADALLVLGAASIGIISGQPLTPLAMGLIIGGVALGGLLGALPYVLEFFANPEASGELSQENAKLWQRLQRLEFRLGDLEAAAGEHPSRSDLVANFAAERARREGSAPAEEPQTGVAFAPEIVSAKTSQQPKPGKPPVTPLRPFGSEGREPAAKPATATSESLIARPAAASTPPEKETLPPQPTTFVRKRPDSGQSSETETAARVDDATAKAPDTPTGQDAKEGSESGEDTPPTELQQRLGTKMSVQELLARAESSRPKPKTVAVEPLSEKAPGETGSGNEGDLPTSLDEIGGEAPKSRGMVNRAFRAKGATNTNRKNGVSRLIQRSQASPGD
ncbi:MAG: hypothetical protein ACFB21_05595 [Opitutales bacterium]